MTKTRNAGQRRTEDNRSRLLDLAAEQFAAQGYEPVSVRDLARQLDLTTGAIYSNFRSKADLLAEVLDRQVRVDMERSRPDMPLPEFVRQSFQRLSDRSTMRALLIEAAAAARTDKELRNRLNPIIANLLERWIADYQDWQEVRHVDSAVHMDGLVRSLWSIELGLGILDAQGALYVNPDALASLVSDYLGSLETTDGPRRSRVPSVATKGQKRRAATGKKGSNRLTPVAALRDSSRAVATQSRLIDAAIELFATRGYRAVTVRDLARETSVTTGSIYGNFANKAILLVEAIEARINQDLERLPVDLVETGSPADLIEFNLAAFARRATLRALMLEGAAAARSDVEIRDRLRRLQDRHLSIWANDLQERLGAQITPGRPEPSTDMQSAVAAVWAAELGLGLMEALDLPTPEPPELAQIFKNMFTRAGLGGAEPSRRPRRRAAK